MKNFYCVVRFVASSSVVNSVVFRSFFVICLFCAAVTSGYAAPGDLDITFGNGGKVTTPVGTGRDLAQAVTLQMDGKIVVVGYARGDFAVVRYNANGTLDPTFGTGGKVLTPVGTNLTDEAYAVAVQPDGKIVVAGWSRSSSSDGDFAVVRYNTDGTLDSGFGMGGKVITSLAADSDLADDVIIQPDGKIVVVGSSGFTDFALVRYNPDGSLDPSFGSGGKALVQVSSISGQARTAAIQPDGRIIVGGSSSVEVGQSAFSRFTLLRVNSNGTLDSSFGTSGKVTTSISDNRSGTIFDVALQPDGKIIAAGNDASGPSSNTAVIRYQPDGSLDSGFGSGGIVTTRVGTTSSFGEAVALQANGKIFVAGKSYSGQNDDFGAVRFNADGSIDSSFGNGGKVITPIGNRDDNVRDAVIQPDGKIIVVGQAEDSAAGFNEDFALVRYLGDAVVSHSAPFDFDGDRRTDYGVFRPSNGVWYLLNSQSGFAATQFGLSGDKLAPADYDGDGRADIAVYRSGAWYLLRSNLGFAAISFGLSDDIPIPADYDGDGKAEIAVYRPSNGTWYLLNLASNQFSAVQFGAGEDKPVAADYDGDGKTDVAVYRPSVGAWYLLQSSLGFAAVQFGIQADKPVPADYDGDGRADQAVYRDGVWYLLRSTLGFAAVSFGLATDKPVAGDYDGDGKADVAVWRSSDGAFYILKSGDNQFSAAQWGTVGDLPVAAAYVR